MTRNRTPLTGQLLDFLSEPRTLNDIRDAFGQSAGVKFTLYNAVKREEVLNLNAGDRTRHGLFVSTKAGSAHATRSPSASRTGVHLQSVWGAPAQ